MNGRKQVVREVEREEKRSEAANTTVLAVRLPAELAGTVRAAAAEAGVSVSEYIRELLEGSAEDGCPRCPEKMMEEDDDDQGAGRRVAERAMRSLEGLLAGWVRRKLAPMLEEERRQAAGGEDY